MEQKKKLIIGGAVAVSVVVALVIFLTWPRSKPNVLVAEEPKYELEDLHNMAPEDGSVLVAFQGFAKYLSAKYGNKRYLPLAPVTGIQVVNGKSTQDLRFDSNHGSVSLGIAMTETDFHIRNITVETKDGDRDKTCYVYDAAIFYNVLAHYECLNPLPMFKCVSNVARPDENEVAELIISAIRVELNGNVDDHKKGEFTNGAKFCDIVSL